MTVLQSFFCAVFDEYNFGKMKINGGVKFFSFSLEEVWKMF